MDSPTEQSNLITLRLVDQIRRQAEEAKAERDEFKQQLRYERELYEREREEWRKASVNDREKYMTELKNLRDQYEKRNEERDKEFYNKISINNDTLINFLRVEMRQKNHKRKEDVCIHEDNSTIISVPNDEDDDGDDEIDPSGYLQIEPSEFKILLKMIKTTVMIKVKIVLLALSPCLLSAAFLYKDYGIIDLIRSSTQTSRFSTLIIIARYPIWSWLLMFVFTDLNKSLSRTCSTWFDMFFGLIFCYACNILFPFLTKNNYDENNIEIEPSTVVKVLIVLQMIIINYINDIIRMSLWETREEGVTLFSHIKSKMVNSIVGIAVLWCWFSMLLGLGSLCTIPNLNPYFEVILVGYVLPLTKIVIIHFALKLADIEAVKWNYDNETKNKYAVSYSLASTLACTIAQLYVITQSSVSFSLFALQYFPHEIIKKFSWLTFHPKYLIARNKILRILKRIFCKKEAVSPVYRDKRVTLEVMESMPIIVHDMLGRQGGEELSVFFTFGCMLPYFQEYFFYRIKSNSSEEIILPSYHDLGIAFASLFIFETLTTLFCFCAFESIGYKLDHKYLQFDLQNIGIYAFAATTFLLFVAASIS